MAGVLHNGLDRGEVKTLVVLEAKSNANEQLEPYGHEELAFHYRFGLELHAYPAEMDIIQLTVEGTLLGPANLIGQKIASEVQRHLDGDTRFGSHLTFNRVTWATRLFIDVLKPGTGLPVPTPQPMISDDRRVIDFKVPAVVPSRAVPASDVDPASLRDPIADGMKRLTRRSLEQGTVSTPLSERPQAHVEAIRADQQRFAADREAEPNPLESRLSRIEAILGRFVDRMETRADPEPTARPVDAPPLTVVPHVNRLTPTGLEIKGGPKPSPGPEAAASYGSGSHVGGAVDLDVVDRLVVTSDHPPLDAGGVGAPNAVRRAAGLPVATVQEVKDARGRPIGVAELPANSF